MTVLVTGGAGYIGSHMVLQLCDAGENVVVLDNLVTGFDWAVDTRATFVRGNAGDMDLVGDLIARNGVAAIIHFAGSIVVPESVADPLKYYGNNTAASRNLLAAAVKGGVRHFIFSSTAAVYGMAALEPVAEDSRLEPMSPYGRSKLMTETMLADVADLAGFAARVATDELAGRAISKADNRRLLYIGGELEDLWWRTSDAPVGSPPSPDDASAIVADIASGRDRASGTISVVEVATGYVDQLLVLVPDDKGKFHVALGGVYSYYEFHQPVSDRLTDEAWRSILAAGEAPARPAWIRPTMR